MPPARHRALVMITGGLLAAPFLSAQVVLSNSGYTENFEKLAEGLPGGWTVSTSATLTSLGTPAEFTTAPTNWSTSHDLGGLFRNSSGATIASTSTAAVQAANPDRALGWRPESAAERNGAITMALENTVGWENFTLSLDVFTFNDVASSTTYAVEYRVGASGAFTQLGASYTTGPAFSLTTSSFSSVTLSALADQPDPVFIRLRGLSSTDTGSMDGVAIDNFRLTYSAVASSAIPEPGTYALIGGVSAFLLALARRKRAIATPEAIPQGQG